MKTNLLRRLLALLLAMVSLFALPVLAEEGEDWEDEDISLEDVETEGDAEDEEIIVSDSEDASIEGLTPLYTTKIKAFVKTGKGINMRLRQDLESDVVTFVKTGEVITIYKVYPSFVLCEYNGYVGYIVRTWIDENMTVLDPENTPPYGVVPSQYVATLTQTTDVHVSPSLDSDVMKIHPAAGCKIAILEFVDGFAKVLYWRSYGYIDASLLTDLVVVSPTLDPEDHDMPIAAFCSFFEYNTGKEGNEGRCKNIAHSADRMSKIMYPGEQMDLNNDVGPWKKANGYYPAPVLINGGSQLGYGGGTCQSSSTLYNTVRQIPGITIVYRKPHGPGCAKYLPMHQDAAVGSSTLNFIFRNDCEFPIRIQAESTGEGTLCIQIFRVYEE